LEIPNLVAAEVKEADDLSKFHTLIRLLTSAAAFSKQALSRKPRLRTIAKSHFRFPVGGHGDPPTGNEFWLSLGCLFPARMNQFAVAAATE
jgi:hypothetical protein